MAEGSSGEKTEEPTARRLAEARRDGNVARSMDLTAAVSLLGAIVLLWMLGMNMLGGMQRVMQTLLAGTHTQNLTRVEDLVQLPALVVSTLVRAVGPFTVLVMFIAAIAVLGQVGFLVTPKPLTPSFSKLNVIKGVQNMFNLKALMRLVMSLGKIGIIGAVAIVIVYRDLPYIIHIAELAPAPAFVAASKMVLMLGLKLAFVLLILAILDFSYQKWQRHQDLKMSKQDVKDEMKRMEGDPMIKQRRARVARQLAMQRTAAAVPKADVIVTNPTHFAVALKYDGTSMHAPKVVAKGADFMAVRIRQLAALHEIPIVERPPLARALYAGVEVGQEIPGEHYAAVAEVLAYVYRLSGQATAAA